MKKKQRLGALSGAMIDAMQGGKPSPMPWRYARFDDDGYLIIQGAVSICAVEIERDAERIVKSVNAHAGLVAALRAALKAGVNCCVNTDDANWHSESCYRKPIRDALRAAGEAT